MRLFVVLKHLRGGSHLHTSYDRHSILVVDLGALGFRCASCLAGTFLIMAICNFRWF